MAFEGCSKLKDFKIPKSVEKIEHFAYIPGPCTFNNTGKNYIYQEFYKCLTCGFSKNAGCCEACAKVCHLGHDFLYRGRIRSYCDCGASEVNGCVPCQCIKIPNPKYQSPQ